MKKFGLLVFAVAIIGSLALVWAMTGKSVIGSSFIHFDVKGSGNTVTEKRNVTGFKGVHTGGAMQLEISVGKEFSVELEGDDNILPTIKTEVRGDKLYFERKEGRIWSRGRVIARVTMPELNDLDISGASSAIVNNVKTESLKIDASGASKIEISGEARDLAVEVSGASKLDAENLKTERTKVEASGASKVSIFASEAVDADASGASKIVYSGNPKSVSKDASGASSVSAN
ncbi:MAG: head GIN domain-containing protein [Pyrinomonadaceae bacterium]